MNDVLNNLAAKHNLSRTAVEVVYQALMQTGGQAAQFTHPELGGMVQWMPGMTMIGDLFNQALKAKVNALCTELAGLIQTHELPTTKITFQIWWDADLGTPTYTGGQNDWQYAYFADLHRLLLKQNSGIYTYDTTGHTLTGVSQQQTTLGASLVFHTLTGIITLDQFKFVSKG